MYKNLNKENLTMNKFNEKFLQRAIELANKSIESGLGGPFGAVVVKNNMIVGEGHNIVTSSNDPTAHAEVVAIRNACKNLNTFQLDDCEIYSSCEPCPMCLGAIYWARPSALYFATSKEDASKAGFDDSFIYDEISLPNDKRKIKTINIPNKEANLVFEKWVVLDNKIDY